MSDPWTPVAIVTGAASGIGLATVRALLKRGASVVTAVCPGPTLTGMTDRLSETHPDRYELPRFVPADELPQER